MGEENSTLTNSKLTNAQAAKILGEIGVAKPGNNPVSEIRAAPEKTYVSEIQSARLNSNTPLQLIDKVTRNVFEHTLEKLRSGLSPEVDKSVTTMVRDAMQMGAYALSGDLFRPGDKQISASVAAQTEKYFDQNGKPSKFGEYDIMSAQGWQPKGDIKVNGKMTTLKEPVSNMLAVFIRNKDGDIEILDPTTKVNGLTELTKLPKAILGTPQTPADKKWQDTAGVHVTTQILPMLASGGAWAAGKIGTAAVAKAPQLTHAVELVGKSALKVNSAAAPVAGVNGVAGLNAMAGQMSQSFIISPQSIEKLANGIADAITHPKGMNEGNVRANLNNALHEYSNKQNSDKQVYIPSLGTKDQPWSRLQESLQGVVSVYQKPNNPWQAWPLAATRIDLPEVNAALSSNPKINHAFYSTVEKHLTGKNLTDQDIFVLRAGMKLGPKDDLARVADLPLAGKNNDMKFSAEERKVTLGYLDDQLNTRLRDKVFDVAGTAKKMGINPDDVDPAMPEFSKNQIRRFVSDEVATNAALIRGPEQTAKAPKPPGLG